MELQEKWVCSILVYLSLSLSLSLFFSFSLSLSLSFSCVYGRVHVCVYVCVPLILYYIALIYNWYNNYFYSTCVSLYKIQATILGVCCPAE